MSNPTGSPVERDRPSRHGQCQRAFDVAHQSAWTVARSRGCPFPADAATALVRIPMPDARLKAVQLSI
ncbi:MAG: hypothetical protein H8E58_00455 [SAR92 clade bacterium]|nr:hypothetical protein [SAR92 clade bacterium]